MRGRLLTAVVPGLVVAACFVIAFMVRRPTSGVDVRTVACCPERPVDAVVSVLRPGRRAVEAGTRTGADGTARLLLQPGRYVLRGVPRGRGRTRRITVLVRDDTFETVTVRFRLRRTRA